MADKDLLDADSMNKSSDMIPEADIDEISVKFFANLKAPGQRDNDPQNSIFHQKFISDLQMENKKSGKYMQRLKMKPYKSVQNFKIIALQQPDLSVIINNISEFNFNVKRFRKPCMYS